MKSLMLKSLVAVVLITGAIYFTSPLLNTYIDKRVEAYLDSHPEKVYASTSKGIDLLKAAEKTAKTRFVHSLKSSLEQDTLDPVLGNPEAKTTVVMFSDYNCGYCKKAHPALQALLSADNDIRIVIKEFPILGSMSQLAAMASLAVYQIDPEQHPIFQNQMFRSTLSTEADIVAIVESLGIAKEDFLAELPKSLYSQKLGGNLSLGEKLQINGTPAFVIDGEIYPGALSSAELLHIVNQARNASTS